MGTPNGMGDGLDCKKRRQWPLFIQCGAGRTTEIEAKYRKLNRGVRR